MASNRKNKFSLQSRLILIIVVIIVTFLAAFLGEVLITSLNTRPSLELSQPFIITGNNNDLEKSKSALLSLEKTEFPSIVEIYSSSPRLELVTEGVVLTNDGWVVSVLSSESETEEWDYIRFNSGELLPVIDVVEDTSMGLAYLQVASSNLTAATLIRQEELQIFDTLLITNSDGILARAEYLGKSKKSDREYSSDRKNSFEKISGNYNSGMVYNLNGELVGLIIPALTSDTTSMIDALSIRSSLDLLLKTSELERPRLGLEYIDLAQTPLLNEPASGAFVTNIDQSITNNTIRLNDLIVSVNGSLLNHQVTLSDLLSNYSSGQTIELGIIRRGDPLTVEITLE